MMLISFLAKSRNILKCEVGSGTWWKPYWLLLLDWRKKTLDVGKSIGRRKFSTAITSFNGMTGIINFPRTHQDSSEKYQKPGGKNFEMSQVEHENKQTETSSNWKFLYWIVLKEMLKCWKFTNWDDCNIFKKLIYDLHSSLLARNSIKLNDLIRNILESSCDTNTPSLVSQPLSRASQTLKNLFGNLRNILFIFSVQIEKEKCGKARKLGERKVCCSWTNFDDFVGILSSKPGLEQVKGLLTISNFCLLSRI